MYIRITRNQKGDGYYHLVESYRSEGKVKQRTLLSLGRIEDGRIEQLAEAINKHLNCRELFDKAKDIDIKDTYILGPLLVLPHMMNKLGINKIIKQIADQHPQIKFDLQNILFTQLCSRFIQPVSKLGLYDRWVERMYPEMIDHKTELQHIYRSLDILAQHKEEIEKFLYSNKKDLFSINVDVVLYDLTTLRFENTREDTDSLRRFGYSKEMRTDCTQVVLGLLTDTDGIPLCFEVHPGNTFEGKTLEGIVEKIRNKFSIRRFIFIADRGLFSFSNLQHIRKCNGEFIVGLKMGVLKEHVQQEFYNLNNYQWINDELAIFETTFGQDRCIITWSKARAERDRKAREDVLDKIRQKLSSKKPLPQKFISNRSYQRYIRILGDNRCELNQQAIAEDTSKDGFFGIITNVLSMTAAQIVFNYKQLWKIEDAFGEIKGTIKTRPMFHWTDHRIIGHLVMCFLAYLCEAHITKILRDKEDLLHSKAINKRIIKQRPLTVLQAMKELCQIMAVPVKIKNNTVWIRTDIPQNALSLFRSIGMKIPPKILK